MSDGRDRRSAGDGGRRKRLVHSADGSTSSWVFGATWLLLALSVISVSGPWAGFHGVLFAGVGLLMLLFPPQVAHPRTWWLLALLFVVCASTAFLPAEWFGIPEWRKNLESLGLETGDRVVIQTQMAAESLILFAIMLFGGLWLAGHRASSAQLRLWAFVFTVGVAVTAVLARTMQNAGWTPVPEHFGFFPNRNHTATYLVMGAICGLGCVLQALRDKRFYTLAASLVAASVCLWALAAWSISRAGVVLVLIGLLLWLPMLGRQYLGRHGLWAIGLILLAAVGFFLTTESTVRERLSKTVEIAGDAIESKSNPAELINEKSQLDSAEYVDFRIPIFLDTLDMIGSQPWTGVGAGQFRFVIPQYRNRTIVAQDADAYHPESDWLWTAAELGVPAALALLTLVVLAVVAAGRKVLTGRDRALRSACLIAALLVPLHGCFDVPGHRISLAWMSILLFSLSLHPPVSHGANCRWPSRTTGLILILASAFLIHAQWFGDRPPATISAQSAIQRAQTLYQEDLALEKSSIAQGIPHQPAPGDDKLEKALRILDTAAQISPLDREIPRHQAFLAFHFDDKFARIHQAFAIDRALDPNWVVGPLRQGETWAHADPSRSVVLFEEALRRSKRVELLDPKNRWNPAGVREYVRNLASRYPDLMRILDSEGLGEWKESEK